MTDEAGPAPQSPDRPAEPQPPGQPEEEGMRNVQNKSVPITASGLTAEGWEYAGSVSVDSGLMWSVIPAT